MFKVIDEIVGETIEFENRFDAEVETERRLSAHRMGYFRRRTYIPPINAVVIDRGEEFIICLG